MLEWLNEQAGGVLKLLLTRDFATAASSPSLSDIRAVTLASWSG